MWKGDLWEEIENLGEMGLLGKMDAGKGPLGTNRECMGLLGKMDVGKGPLARNREFGVKCENGCVKGTFGKI